MEKDLYKFRLYKIVETPFRNRYHLIILKKERKKLKQ